MRLLEVAEEKKEPGGAQAEVGWFPEAADESTDVCGARLELMTARVGVGKFSSCGSRGACGGKGAASSPDMVNRRES